MPKSVARRQIGRSSSPTPTLRCGAAGQRACAGDGAAGGALKGRLAVWPVGLASFALVWRSAPPIGSRIGWQATEDGLPLPSAGAAIIAARRFEAERLGGGRRCCSTSGSGERRSPRSRGCALSLSRSPSRSRPLALLRALETDALSLAGPVQLRRSPPPPSRLDDQTGPHHRHAPPPTASAGRLNSFKPRARAVRPFHHFFSADPPLFSSWVCPRSARCGTSSGWRSSSRPTPSCSS